MVSTPGIDPALGITLFSGIESTTCGVLTPPMVTGLGSDVSVAPTPPLVAAPTSANVGCAPAGSEVCPK